MLGGWDNIWGDRSIHQSVTDKVQLGFVEQSNRTAEARGATAYQASAIHISDQLLRWGG